MAGLILSNRKNGTYRDPFAALTRDFFSWEPLGRRATAKPGVAPNFAPVVNVLESEISFVAELDVPGVAEADIEVTLDGKQLTISGKREASETQDADTLHIQERRFGSFSRSFTLPDIIDGENIRANLEAGVLTVTIPKVPAATPRKIPVGTAK